MGLSNNIGIWTPKMAILFWFPWSFLAQRRGRASGQPVQANGHASFMTLFVQLSHVDLSHLSTCVPHLSRFWTFMFEAHHEASCSSVQCAWSIWTLLANYCTACLLRTDCFSNISVHQADYGVERPSPNSLSCSNNHLGCMRLFFFHMYSSCSINHLGRTRFLFVFTPFTCAANISRPPNEQILVRSFGGSMVPGHAAPLRRALPTAGWEGGGV